MICSLLELHEARPTDWTAEGKFGRRLREITGVGEH